jgi:hypothetical protein
MPLDFFLQQSYNVGLVQVDVAIDYDVVNEFPFWIGTQMSSVSQIVGKVEREI